MFMEAIITSIISERRGHFRIIPAVLTDSDDTHSQAIGDCANIQTLPPGGGKAVVPCFRLSLTQEEVAGLMGTTKSAVSRLEAIGKHAPSLTTLKKSCNSF
jgi:hypothetical protein